MRTQLRTTQPAYLNSVLEHYTPARALRSSDTNLLSVPRVTIYVLNVVACLHVLLTLAYSYSCVSSV